ncbi:MAG: hypothetical protein WAU91_18525 [Desulfatitalea sp.]
MKVESEKTKADELHRLFGQWSQEEFMAIQGKIDGERTIDPELWEQTAS